MSDDDENALVSPNQSVFITIDGQTMNVGNLAMDIVLAGDDWTELAKAYEINPRRLEYAAKHDVRISAEVASITAHAKTLGNNWRMYLRAGAALNASIENIAMIAAGTRAGASPADSIKAFNSLREMVDGVPGASQINNGNVFNFHSIKDIPQEILATIVKDKKAPTVINAEEIWDDV